MLTDLIQERHLKWLGDVEWEGHNHAGTHLYRLKQSGLNWKVQIRVSSARWMDYGWRSDREVCFILEHAIRVMLMEHGYRFIDSERHEENLIAAMDNLIESENGKAPKEA